VSRLRRTYQGQTVALYVKPRPPRPWWDNSWGRRKRAPALGRTIDTQIATGVAALALSLARFNQAVAEAARGLATCAQPPREDL
jgi:hypothetical protein